MMRQPLIEQFTLSPYKDITPVLEEFNPMEEFIIESGYEEALKEATDMTKQNIFQKMWGVIQRAIRWIIKQVGRILKGIRNFLIGDSRKTGDQLMRELENAGYLGATEQAATVIGSSFAGFVQEIRREGIILNQNFLVTDKAHDLAAIKGKDIYQAGYRATLVINLMKNPAILDEYIEIFEALVSREFAVKPVDISRIKSLSRDKDIDSGKKDSDGKIDLIRMLGNVGIDKVTDNALRGTAGNVLVTMEELIDFQLKVDKLSVIGEKFDNFHRALNIDPNSIKKKSYMDLLNQLSWLCVNLQGGLHAISNGLQNIYLISSVYNGTIQSPEALARFTEEAVNSGMPGKYIVHNIYNACDSKIKGDPNLDKPIMGYGRLTLIPSAGENDPYKDIVFKIAINQYGVRSNRNDLRVFESFRKHPELQSRLATTKKTHNYFVNEMEKINAGSSYEPSAGQAKAWQERFNKEQAGAGVTGFIIKDTKPDAFGMRNPYAKKSDYWNAFILVDYGMIYRTSPTAS